MGQPSGKGISAAVRTHVAKWMTNRVVELLWQEYKKHASLSETFNTFSFKVRKSEQWVRIARTRSLSGKHKRTFYSKMFGKGGNRQVGLTVTTNSEDSHIEYVAITVGMKVIGGGTVKVASVFHSQAGNKTSLKIDEENTIFTEFTTKELADLSAQLEFGDNGSFDLMFEGRE